MIGPSLLRQHVTDYKDISVMKDGMSPNRTEDG